MRSFTLVEVMVVAAIIALLAAVAIPNLLRARISAQEPAATVALHAIVAAQTQWRASNATYATLGQLGAANPPYISAALGCAGASCTKQGYSFTVVPNAGTNFYATAVCITGNAHSFYIDEEGVLCRSDAVAAAAAGAHQDAGCPAGYTEMQ